MKPSRSRLFFTVSVLLLGASLEAGAQGLSVSDASVSEGNSGTKNITFTVTRNGSTAAVTFDYATAASVAGPGVFPATSNVDFLSAVGSGSIPAGVDGATTTVTVQVAGDSVDEEAEVFELTISNLSGGMGIVDGTGVGTIVDNDNAPTLAFSNVTLLEGDSGTANATFTFTLNKASERVISVLAQTANGSAIAPQDYASNAQTITFNPGVTSQTFDVAVVGDTIDEFNETFSVSLSAAVNVSVPIPTRQGTIQDNDALPALSINDVAFAEGDAGTTVASFTVTLSSASEKVVTFEYVTADASATAASGDYAAAGPTTLVFNPGDPLTKTINIGVNGDTGNESDETFRVVLSGVTGSAINATFADATGVATIQNDDAVPDMSIGDVLVTEGTGGSTNAVFHITLSAASGQNVTVRASLAAGDTQAADYANPGPQIITFLPGETDKTYVVPVTGDALDEYDEYFVVNLANVSHANLLNSYAYGDIDDDDDEPELSITDASVTEGNSGTVPMTFTVSLSAPSGKTVEVVAVTSDFSWDFTPGTATMGPPNPSDFTFKGQNLVFTPGQTSKTFTVTVRGDTIPEPDEDFYVLLGAELNATLADDEGHGVILNDEPGLLIEKTSSPEGTDLTFTVTRVMSGAAVSFDYATSDGTATLADNDYTSTSGSGSIPAGSAGDTTTIVVPTTADTLYEGHETVTVTLSNVVGLPALTTTADGTILNDDAFTTGLLISEFRTSGPGGAQDQYIEIANTTSLPIEIASPDGSGGFSVGSAGTRLFTIPDGTVIPAKGHLLGGNFDGYSLFNYGGASCACEDFLFDRDLGQDAGIALFDTDDEGQYAFRAPIDAVGFTTDAAPYVEGAGLAPIGISAAEHAFVRRYATGGGSSLVDSGDNVADFILIDTAAQNIGGTLAALGAPSPENLDAEVEYANSDLALTSIWPANNPNGPFNREVVPAAGGDPAGFELRRRVTNNTSDDLTFLRFKVTTITTLNNRVAGQADIRPISSPTLGPIALPDSSTSTPQGLDLELSPPEYGMFTAGTATPEGGLNSTLRLSTGLPLLAGSSVDVNFRVFVHAAGTYQYWVVIEAKP